jgi:hypothetical protein
MLFRFLSSGVNAGVEVVVVYIYYIINSFINNLFLQIIRNRERQI